jgi:hypothetical protein
MIGNEMLSELFEHRYALFCMAAQLANWGKGDRKLKGFKAWKHSDGSPTGEDCFIAGLELPEIGQIICTFPKEYWVKVHLPHYDRAPEAPEWGEHSSGDVAESILKWVELRDCV